MKTDAQHTPIIPGASAAFAFAQIGKFPRPAFAPEDGTGSSGTPAAGEGGGDAAGSANGGAEAGNSDPGSLIGSNPSGEEGDPAKDVGSDGGPDADKDGEGGDPDPLDAVPDGGSYDFSALDLPEGMEIDQHLADMVGPRMAEANLSQRQANTVAEIFTDMRKQQVEDWQKVNSDWQAEVKADKEIGGDNLNTTISHADKFIEQFGTKELRDYLTSSGGGNNPEIIRAFARAGKMLAEDDPPGRSGGNGAKDTAAILYPND